MVLEYLSFYHPLVIICIFLDIEIGPSIPFGHYPYSRPNLYPVPEADREKPELQAFFVWGKKYDREVLQCRLDRERFSFVMTETIYAEKAFAYTLKNTRNRRIFAHLTQDTVRRKVFHSPLLCVSLDNTA
jgi:hypothetical protein